MLLDEVVLIAHIVEERPDDSHKDRRAFGVVASATDHLNDMILAVSHIGSQLTLSELLVDFGEFISANNASLTLKLAVEVNLVLEQSSVIVDLSKQTLLGVVGSLRHDFLQVTLLLHVLLNHVVLLGSHRLKSSLLDLLDSSTGFLGLSKLLVSIQVHLLLVIPSPVRVHELADHLASEEGIAERLVDSARGILRDVPDSILLRLLLIKDPLHLVLLPDALVKLWEGELKELVDDLGTRHSIIDLLYHGRVQIGEIRGHCSQLSSLVRD